MVGEPSNRFPELRPHQHQGVPQPVALLVKGRGPEVVFGGSVEEVDLGGVAEDASQVFQLLASELLDQALGAPGDDGVVVLELLDVGAEGVAQDPALEGEILQVF